jgi:hypothetical protein
MQDMFMLSLTVWSLAIMPSLCIGGLIAHPCGARCTPSHSSDVEQKGSCDHEANCEADPCSIASVRSDEFDADWLAAIDHAPLSMTESAGHHEADHQLPALPRPDLRLRGDNLPFPQADIPLLI